LSGALILVPAESVPGFSGERLSEELELVFDLPEALRKIRLSTEAVYCAAERQQIQCRVGPGALGRCQESVSPQG